MGIQFALSITVDFLFAWLTETGRFPTVEQLSVLAQGPSVTRSHVVPLFLCGWKGSTEHRSLKPLPGVSAHLAVSVKQTPEGVIQTGARGLESDRYTTALVPTRQLDIIAKSNWEKQRFACSESAHQALVLEAGKAEAVMRMSWPRAPDYQIL